MKQLKKIWSLSAILGMVIGIFPMTIFAETIEAADVVINQVEITDTEDQEITEKNRLNNKDAIKVKLTWSLANATLIEDGAMVAVDLPKNLNYPEQSGSLGEMGHYQLSSQQVIFQFNKNYQDTADGRVPEFSSAKFYEGVMELTAETTAEDVETETVDFGNNLVQTLYYNKKVDPAADPLDTVEAEQEKNERQSRASDPNLNARGVKLFHNIKITDFNGDEYTEEHPALYNDNIEIKIDWRLDNDEDISDGDYYTYQLPDYFAIHNVVVGDLVRKNSNGTEDKLGTFELDKNGELKVIFNDTGKNLSERSGVINLKTELKLDSTLEKQVIETGIQDDEDKEISLVVPIYHSDIAKKGAITDQATINWEITFNQDSKALTNVEVEDVLPEADFVYTVYDNEIVVNVDLYDKETETWSSAAKGFYTFDEASKTFKFHETITTPVKIYFTAKIVDTAKRFFTNTATIKSSQFSEKSVSATVSYEEQEAYKRAVSYDSSKREVSWEVAVSLKSANDYILDKTYDGTDSSRALHYLVEDSIVVTDKQGNAVADSTWDLSSEDRIEKEGKPVQFKLTFSAAGNYLITYKTKLFNELFGNTTIKNYMTVTDGGDSQDHTGQTTIGPTGNIGVKKSEGGSGNVNLEKIQTKWTTTINSEKKQIKNVVITDRYQKSDGSNKSALELIDDDAPTTAEEDKFKITNSDGNVLEKGKDYELVRLTASEGGVDYESGFQVTFKGAYGEFDEELTMTYTTKFDIRKQVEQLDGQSNRLDNSVIVEYTASDDITYKEGSEATRWLQPLWLNNASKGGFFVAEGESVAAGLNQYIGWNPSATPFTETTAPKDSVYWLATFNFYKETIEKNATIIEKLGEGQTLRELTICETELLHNGRQITNFKDKLEEEKDYKYELTASGEIVITFLKETNKTFSVALAVDASEDVFKYKNYAELRDASDQEIVHTEGEVIKSDKDMWLKKDGLQDADNNRLANWQVLINQDARTINDAIVSDTIKLNQQSFVLNNQDEVSVQVFHAKAKDGGFEKGEEVIEGFKSSVTMDAINGTQTMTIEFESPINSPYIIEYQTKLDPGIVNNEKITNDVRLNGSATEIHQVTKEIQIKSTDGSGTSTGVNGALIINKIDSDTKEAISKSAHFEISRKNADGNYESFISDVEVKENKIVAGDGTLVEELSNLRYGDYAIKEITAPEGYVLDDTLYEFTIDANTQTYTFTLENTKKVAEPVKLTLEAKKELSGRPLKADEFSFSLKGDGVDQTKKNTADGKITFDTISYDKAGTYEYTISEVVPNDNDKEIGVTYDETNYKVIVEVEEKAGKLEATATYEDLQSGEDVPVFKNTYKALPGNVQLEAKKELSGRPLKANEFSFNLKGDTIDQTKKNTADGKVTFEAITYDKAGTYEYTISEVIPNDKEPGLTYDEAKYKVTVDVEEKAGKLEATATYEGLKSGEVPTFKNVYKAMPGSVVLEAKKELSGRPLKADEFSFNLKGDTVDQTKKNTADGKITFDTISYDKAGTYEYTISEVVPNDNDKEIGVTYDETNYKVIVEVEEKAGKLEATATYEGLQSGEDVPVFKNAYKALSGSVVLEATKELTGKELNADQFNFELVDSTGNVLQTQQNEANGTVTFDAIHYTEAGTHEYTIKEVEGTDPTITYDATEYQVTVKVEDKNGQLVATPTYAGNAVFKNTYKPVSGSVVLEAAKELTGKELTTHQFSFQLLDADKKVLQTKQNDTNGKIYFDAIEYTEIGEHEYIIKEVDDVKDTDQTITYDQTEYQVTVKVEDKNGQLVATPTYAGNAVFKNAYKPAAGSVVLEAEKELIGKELSVGQFDFELVDNKGAVLQTKQNDGNGNVYFDAIAYDKAGTYEYVIKEVKGTDGTITYDQTEYKVSVKVEDKAGHLIATPTYEKEAIFKNTYTPAAGSVVLEAEKELVGKELSVGQFDFELVDSKGAVLQTKQNDGSGNIYFDAIAYDKAGTYEYIIKEVKGTDSTIIYDQTEYKVNVKVEDKAGKLIATPTYEKEAIFKNTYKPAAGSVVLKAAKELTGKELRANQFDFELLNSKGEVLQTKSNHANGEITFEALTYDKAGRYEYTILEVIPTDKENGITYDDTEYKVTVTVEDKGGVLEAKEVYENTKTGDIPTFNNLYTPEKKVPAGEILLKKVDSKTGKTLADAEFKLVDAKDQPVSGQEKIVTGEDGTIFIKGLADGSYKLIETKAPTGYQLDETPIEFTVKDNQPSKKEISKENSRVNLPNTGNSSNTHTNNGGTNTQTTYRNQAGSSSATSRRLPSTGSIRNNKLIILGLFFLSVVILVVFGKRKKV